jgi:uncharacterized protein involved in type VI secretion and phage assembly
MSSLTEEPIESFPDAATFAKAVLEAILEGLLEGYGDCIGIPELRAGEMVQIAGVGKRFGGAYRLRRVTHTIDNSGYRTNFEVTQRSSSTMLQLFRKYLDEDSPNEMKKRDSAVVGTVVNNVDPEGLGRIQVRYPWLSDTVISNWARVAQADKSSYFMPDIGDDVWVTFDRGNFDRPVVIGTLWNVANMPPELPTPANFKKVIGSRMGHRITVDDTPVTGGLLLETSGGAKLHLDALGNIALEAGPTGTISLKTAGRTVDIGQAAVNIS